MKKPLSHTKVTVKLRRAQYKEEWYLIVEAYPVVSAGNKVERIVESVNRSITTPIWDKSSTTRSSGYKPKRDINGIIMCRSTLDQESCIYADNVRKLRQHEYDNQSLYTDKESEIEDFYNLISSYCSYILSVFQGYIDTEEFKKWKGTSL